MDIKCKSNLHYLCLYQFSLVNASSGAHAYGAEANASSASNVDELHQEISVRSAVVIIPLIIVWTHTHIPWSIF